MCLSTIKVNAQIQETPYDHIPGLNKSYKPAYQADFPDWAQMLYQFPVNYKQLLDTYNNASNSIAPEHKVINRYCKIGRAHV